jgi:hypothetical protein
MRALLSHVETSISGAFSAAREHGTFEGKLALASERSRHLHPLIETNPQEPVTNLSGINAQYVGPKRPDLHVRVTHARFFYPKGFAFSGLTVGVINPSQSAYYVFGVNRGGASAPGPFPGRPNIVFDAEIIVRTSPNGYTGTVEQLNSKGQVTSTASLINPAVIFSGHHVRVVVSAALLPPTSPAGTAHPENEYSYAFWAGISPSAPKGIASFVPVNGDQSVPTTAFPPS